MVEETATIVNKSGLHARPASALVRVASRFVSDIWLASDDQEVNAKSIMGVMILGAAEGTRITVRAEGDDEEEAVQSLVDLIENGLEEQDLT